MKEKESDKHWECGYCGKWFLQPCPHICKGTMRKRKLSFTNYLTSEKYPKHQDNTH